MKGIYILYSPVERRLYAQLNNTTLPIKSETTPFCSIERFTKINILFKAVDGVVSISTLADGNEKYRSCL